MSAFTDSFYGSVPQTMSTRLFDNDDTYIGYDSQPFDDSFASGNDVFESQPRIYRDFSLEEDGEFGGSESPILPPPSETEAKEGFALREWRRRNAIQLEEKEKHEKKLLSEIIKEADKYKVEFYKKREITCKNNKTNNREKEKLFIVNREKFHAEADKNYWKLIAELIPNEVRAIGKKKGEEDQVKKPAIAVIQGPKPGKPTELSRMRQIFLNLKYNSPSHLKRSSTPTAAPANEAKTSDIAVATTSLIAASLGTASEPVAVA